MAFTVTVTSADGETERTFVPGQDDAFGFSAERPRGEGFGPGQVSFPARFDELVDIAWGDRIEARLDGVLHWRGYVRQKTRSWNGSTPMLTLGASGIAKRAWAIEVPGEYGFADTTDRAAAWETIATETVLALMPGLVLDAQEVGLPIDRVEGTYRSFGEVVAQLLKGCEDIAVAGCDVDEDGNDRIFFRPASTSADYTFPIPDPASNPNTNQAGGLVSIEGVYNVLRIQGGAPPLPNLWPNPRFDRLTGRGSAVGARAAGVELWAHGSAAIVAQQWDYVGGGIGRNALKLSGTAADNDANCLSLRLSGREPIALANRAQPLRFEARVKGFSGGTLPKLILRLEWLDENQQHLDAEVGVPYSEGVVAAGSGYSDWTNLALSVPTPPPGAVRVIAELLIRGDADDMVVDCLSLMDNASTAAQWLPEGNFTLRIEASDPVLEDYGILADAADSAALYTGGILQLGTLQDETICTLHNAYQAAAAWFNRNARPTPEPSFTRLDDTTVYWPGQGVTLTGEQGAALMGGLEFVPIESVKLSWEGGIFKQRIECRRRIGDKPDALGKALTDRSRDQGQQAVRDACTPSASGVGTSSGRTASPPGYTLPYRPELAGSFDPPQITTNEHGAIVSIGPSAAATAGKRGFGCTFRNIPDQCKLDAGAGDSGIVQFPGRITGWELEVEGSGILTLAVKRWTYDPDAGTATYVSVTGGDNPTITGTGTASGDAAAWDADFLEGDEFRTEVLSCSGTIRTAKLFVTTQIDNDTLTD